MVGVGENEDAKPISIISSLIGRIFYIERKLGYQIEKYSIFFRGELGRKMEKTAKKETVFVTSLCKRGENKLEERVTDR